MLETLHGTRSHRLAVAFAAALCCLSVSALGANHVRIDNISNVPPGTMNLQIGVYLSNDEPIAGCVLPFEIRTCSRGAYIVGPTFDHGQNPAGRLYNSPLSRDADPNGMWPGAIHVVRTFAADIPAIPNACTRRSDSTRAWHVDAPLPDFISPDAFFMAAVSQGDPRIGELTDLPPGADPAGVPSYIITVNVGSTTGLFVIDTTCVVPANILEYVVNDIPGNNIYTIRPTFEKGVIGVGVAVGPCSPVGCDCACHGEPANCGEGESLGILDVVTTIDVAFRSFPEVMSQNCPYYNTDLDCSGATDVVDVVKAVKVEFRNADPTTEWCDPCGL